MEYNPSQLKDLAERYANFGCAREIFEDLTKFELVKNAYLIPKGKQCMLYCVAGCMRGTLVKATRVNRDKFEVDEIIEGHWKPSGHYHSYTSEADYIYRGIGGKLLSSDIDEIIKDLKEGEFEADAYDEANAFAFVVVWNSEETGSTLHRVENPPEVTTITVNGKTINPLDLSTECLKELLKFA